MVIERYIYLAIALFCIGIVGVLARRNAIIIFMCIELMLNAVNLLLVAFSKMHHLAAGPAHPNVGSEAQLFVFFIMVVAAAEVSVIGVLAIPVVDMLPPDLEICMMRRSRTVPSSGS